MTAMGFRNIHTLKNLECAVHTTILFTIVPFLRLHIDTILKAPSKDISNIAREPIHFFNQPLFEPIELAAGLTSNKGDIVQVSQNVSDGDRIISKIVPLRTFFFIF